MEELNLFTGLDPENTEALGERVLTLLSEKSFAALREFLSTIPAADVALLFEELAEELHPRLYRILPKEEAAEVFALMSPDAQERLISCFSDRELGEILEEMYLDDTVDMIEEMPASVVARILKNASAEMRKEINALLRYPRDSAGSLMTTELVRLRKDMTVRDAFENIRRDAINKETIYTCYITDEKRHLEGIVTAKALLISNPDAVLADIMEENVIYADTLTDKEEVAKLFDKYDFLALPVVDAERRLVGIVTVDDAIDVMQEEAEEDFAKMAAITPTEAPYLKSSALSVFMSRIPWLMLLMISSTFTGMIISGFEAALSSCVVLTAFIPMLMGTGGNSGSQSSVAVIRGLSLGDVTPRDAFRVMLKELCVSLLCAVSLGVVAFGKILLIDRLLMQNADITVPIAFAVSATLALTVIAAKLIGAALPLLAERVKLDPAVMASPFITTLVDAISLLVYFAVATSILPI